jgi:hypothetical protein
MQLDDPVVVQILDDASQALVTMASALRAKLGDDLPVAMHGGIFGNARIREAFVAGTGAVEPARTPEFGALHLLAAATGAYRDGGWAVR